MDDIAGDLELSKTTIYLYFKNKPSLYFAVVIKGIVILRDTFKKGMENETTGLGKILGIIRSYFDYMQDYSDYYRLNLSSRNLRFTKMLQKDKDEGPEIENATEYIALIKELLEMLIDAVNLGIRDGTLKKKLDSIQTVMFLGSAIEAIVYISPENQILLDMYGMTKESYIQHSTNILLRGIAGEQKIL